MTKLSDEDCRPFVPARIGQWVYWVVEREKMRRRHAQSKAVNALGQYSTDPVMAGTRWCNVRRMDDKVSRWLMDHYYPESAFAADMAEFQPNELVCAALLARMVNRTDTLKHITQGNRFKRFDYDNALKAMYEVKASGVPVFTNAYIINGASGGPKIEQVLNAIRQCQTGKAGDFLFPVSMRITAQALHRLPGIGGFMAGQVVADLRWVLKGSRYWLDRMVWAPPGPGSSRGMKYLLGYADAKGMTGRGKDLSEKEFLLHLPRLVELARTLPQVRDVFADRQLEAHDIQNTLCELSKFVRVSDGGHAKNKYPPKDI